jgi:hypothetical protein
VSLTRGNIDDVGKSLPGAGFGCKLVEHARSVAAVVFRSDKRIFFLKFIEQRLQLIDGGKTIDHDLTFFFGALAEFLFALFALQAVVGPKRGRALREAERTGKRSS